MYFCWCQRSIFSSWPGTCVNYIRSILEWLHMEQSFETVQIYSKNIVTSLACFLDQSNNLHCKMESD